MSLVVIVVFANLGLGPVYFPLVFNVPGLDKVGHFFLMGMLTLLVNVLFKSKRIQILSLNFFLGSLLVTLVVTLEELSQLFLIYRAFSWLDLFFDLGGIFLGGRLAYRMMKKREVEV